MDGRLAQVGTPHQIFNQPASAQVAAFIGSPPMNLFPAQLENGVLSIAGARLSGAFAPPSATLLAVTAGVRPGDLQFCAEGGLLADVEFVEDFGDSAIVNLSINGQRAKMRTDRRDLPAEGAQLRVMPRPGSVHLFSESDGSRLSI
jgi:ABC-type sugar transport system ATPase subunit